MAQGGAHSKAEEDPEAAVEGAPGVEPIHQDLGQEPRNQSFQDAPQIQTRGQSCKEERAQAEAEGKTVVVKKPIVVKYGLNHVTYPIEQNKPQLVVIAHDVDPIELVVWLPALCRKMEIPYCIVKGKSRLGSIVHKKTASVLCLTSVKNEDKLEFSKILEAIKANFNDKFDELRSGVAVSWVRNLRPRREPGRSFSPRKLLRG